MLISFSLGLHQGGVQSWALAAAFAYSSQWNRRRIEWHLYGLWAMVMSDLVADLSPHALVVPQFGFDFMPEPPETKAQSSDEDEEQCSDEDESEGDEQVADASFETVSAKDAKKLIPDISILLLRHHLRDEHMAQPGVTGMDLDNNHGYSTPVNIPPRFDTWDAIKIQAIKAPCIF